MKSAEEIISALKRELNVRCDKELAELLDIRPHKLTQWKKNNEADVKLIVERFSNIDLTAVFNDDCYQKIGELNKQRTLEELQSKLQEKDPVFVYYLRFNESEDTLEGHVHHAWGHKFVFGDVDTVYYDTLLYPGYKEAVKVKAVIDDNYIAAGPNEENCKVTQKLDKAIFKLFTFIHLRNVYVYNVDRIGFRAFREGDLPYPPIYIHQKDGSVNLAERSAIQKALEEHSDDLFKVYPSDLDFYEGNDFQYFLNDERFELSCSCQIDDLEALENLKHELESETEEQLVSFDDIQKEERLRATHPNFK